MREERGPTGTLIDPSDISRVKMTIVREANDEAPSAAKKGDTEPSKVIVQAIEMNNEALFEINQKV